MAKEKSTGITKIEISTKSGKVLECTLEEAKEIFEQFNELFGKNKKTAKSNQNELKELKELLEEIEKQKKDTKPLIPDPWIPWKPSEPWTSPNKPWTYPWPEIWCGDTDTTSTTSISYADKLTAHNNTIQ